MALQEAEDAITSAIDQGRAVDLTPQNAYVRRLQHRLAERYNLSSRSRGKEPNRHVRIFPERIDDESCRQGERERRVGKCRATASASLCPWPRQLPVDLSTAVLYTRAINGALEKRAHGGN